MMSRVFSKIIEKRVCLIKMKHTSVWTEDRIVKSPFKNIVIPESTISEYMWKNLDKWADKTAVVCGVTDRKYTYIELHRQSQTLAACLRKKFKIQDGDSVAVMLPNSPEYPVVALGILGAGAILTTINPVYTAYEVQKQFISSDVKLVVTDPGNVQVIKEALKLSKLNVPTVVVDIEKARPENTVSFKEIINDSHVDKDILKHVKTEPHDTAVLLYSSGTTGLPKAVELTNMNIVSNCEQQNDELSKKYNDTTGTNQDTTFAYLPMFHCYGLSVVAFHKLSVGMKLVTVPKFHPETFLGVMEKHKFNLICMAPPTVLFLASSPLVKSKHFEKLQYVTVGAAPLPIPDVDRFLNRIDHDIHFSQVYGLTEVSPLATTQLNSAKDYHTVGYAVPNCELRIVDDELKNLGPDEMGELLIKGPNVMKGYKDNPKANLDTFVDGWLKTGDRAKIDARGCVIIADRLKELIKVNAYQVAPAELESVVREHPAVFDAAVVGIPDDKTGEKPKAFVVLNAGFNVNEKDIIDYVSEKVAPYKRIKEVQMVDNIPKNPSGKILRRVLAQQ